MADPLAGAITDGSAGYEEDDHKPLRDMVIFVTCGISMFLCLCVMSIYFAIRSTNRVLANRVSLRIAVTISAVDFFFELANITSQITNEDRQTLCSISMYGIIFFGLLSTLLTSCIAFNLLFVFVLKRPTTSTLEAIYFGFTFAISFALPTLAIATGRIGWAGGECWFKTNEGEASNVLYAWEWGIFYGWVLFTIIFCAAVLIAVRTKLSKEQSKIISDLHTRHTISDSRSQTTGITAQIARRNAQKAKKMKKLVNQAISRIAWYPIVPLLSQIMNIGADADGFINGKIRWQMLVAANFGLGLMGTMNAIIFFFDPNVERWWKELRYQYVVRHYFVRTPPDAPIELKSRSNIGLETSQGDSFRVLPSLDLDQAPELRPQHQTSTIKYWIAKYFMLRYGDHARRIKELGLAKKASTKRSENQMSHKRPQHKYPPTSPQSSSFGGLSDEENYGSGRTGHTISTVSSNSNERVAEEIQML